MREAEEAMKSSNPSLAALSSVDLYFASDHIFLFRTP